MVATITVGSEGHDLAVNNLGQPIEVSLYYYYCCLLFLLIKSR